MKRTTITLAALVVALVPAAAGLWGNASFSQAVPVRVPASGQVVTGTATMPSGTTTADDHGGDTPRDQRTEPGDDRDHSATSTRSSGTSGHSGRGHSGSSTPSGTSTTADDHGGKTPRDQRTEPGDDRGSATSGSSGSGSSGSGSSGSGSSGSGSGGHGGSDDSGAGHHGGHGSDD